jgi:hypothetical protein
MPIFIHVRVMQSFLQSRFSIFDFSPARTSEAASISSLRRTASWKQIARATAAVLRRENVAPKQCCRSACPQLYRNHAKIASAKSPRLRICHIRIRPAKCRKGVSENRGVINSSMTYSFNAAMLSGSTCR